MRQRKELMAMIAAAAVAVVFLLGFLFFNAGWRTAPIKRFPDQNQGVNAPLEVAPSPGTGPDKEGSQTP